MREIKFRAYADGKMHYPTTGKWWYLDCYTGYWSLNIGDCPGEIICDSLESKDPHLMQNTGLKDCTGKDIYEGDIVEFDAREWGSGQNRWWAVKWDDREGAWDTGGGLNTECGDWKTVVGNIYEDPELLK